ncbi:MAG TPA: alpha/beta fold hydrolase [Thermodesulfobacteriota bacterium]|nr:alpha/beta fold hydrolase [Thermodesulfobacteriota bacterium]
MKNLLFIHGWATDARVWDGCLEEIAEGRPVHNMDLPGHGATGRWSEPTLAPALLGLHGVMAGLERRSVVGIGWSLGAQALMAAASRYNEKFSGLVLVGATPCFVAKEDFPHAQSRALVKRMIRDMKKDPAETVKRFYELNFTSGELKTPEAEAFIERYKYPGPFECAEGGDGSPAGCLPSFRYDEITTALEALCNTDLRERLPYIDVPTLVIHGDADAVCPVGAGRYLASGIRGAELEVFSATGHAPFITNKKRFVEGVKRFLKRVEKPF